MVAHGDPDLPHGWPHRRAGLRPALVDARVLCLSLLIVFVGNSSLNVAHPDAVARARTPPSRSCSGSSPPTRSCSPACCSRPARSATASGARARCSSGSSSSSSAPSLASQSTDDVAADRVPRADGRRRPRSSCRRRCRSSSTSSRPTSAPRRSRSGRASPARRARSARSPAAGCSGTSGTARCSSSTSRSSLLALVARLVPRAEVDATPSRRSSTRSAPCCRSSASSRSSTGSSRRPSKGWASAGDARRVRDRASSCSRSSSLWELPRRRADARHALLPQPGVQHRHRRHDPRVPGDVRRDVPHHAVLPARARLQPARRRAAAAADGADHDRRRAAHAAARARASARNRVGRLRHGR